MNDQPTNDLRGAEVIILTGVWAGHEGICLGRAADGSRYAVSPNDCDQILQLSFEQEFGLLVDLSANQGLN